MQKETKTNEALKFSMVRYLPPIEVIDIPAQKDKDVTKDKKAAEDIEMKFPKAINTTQQQNDNSGGDVTNQELEELLNSIIPPRYWEANGKTWQQSVSIDPATREDVIRLQDLLDTRLAKTQARDTGLCMVRHGIYAECFDEIIRQATINCTERGLLLLRIRDEMKMTLDACEVLYGNAVEFGLRKAIQAAKEKEELTKRVKELAVAHVTVEKSLEDSKQKFEQIQVHTAELYAAEEKRFAEELEFVKKSNAQLKSQLEAITAPRK